MEEQKLGLRIGPQISNKAQASLEMAVAIACLFLLLLGALQIFIWVNKRLVVRQEEYERQRVEAGSTNPGVQVNELDQSKFPRLNIFGE